MSISTVSNSEVEVVEDDKSVADLLADVHHKSELDTTRFRMSCSDPRASR